MQGRAPLVVREEYGQFHENDELGIGKQLQSG